MKNKKLIIEALLKMLVVVVGFFGVWYIAKKADYKAERLEKENVELKAKIDSLQTKVINDEEQLQRSSELINNLITH